MYEDMKSHPYPLNLYYTVLCNDVRHPVPSDLSVIFEFLLDNRMPPQTSEILRLYYRDQTPLKDIAVRYKLTSRQIRQMIDKGIQKLRHPSRSRFLLFGYAEAIRYETERAAEEAQKAARKAEISAAFEQVKGTGPLHEISDINLRIDAVLERYSSRHLDGRRTRLIHRLQYELDDIGYPSIWHCCFLTEDDILALPSGKPSYVKNIKRVLALYDLELDDGTLSADLKYLAYAKERLSAYYGWSPLKR